MLHNCEHNHEERFKKAANGLQRAVGKAPVTTPIKIRHVACSRRVHVAALGSR
jgi:hypothetical protein